MSVLFADLVGFTALAEKRDPEAVRELLTEYYELAREVAGRYRGSIEKFIGDAVMALWGAPVAREDDAERAVRCALDLVSSVEGLATRREIPELAVRAGVHTGEAAVSIGEAGQGLVAGDVVNTASRLQSAAQPGTVVVGEATQRAASRSIAFRRLPDLSLKGKSEAVSVWQATHLVALVGGEGARSSGGLEPPFVGRADEMRLLKELYHATVREGRARLVSVMGQAGIGKTRLAWELQKYATGLADESRWLQGRSPAYQEGISYWALSEIVRRAAGIAEDEDPASSRQKLERLLAREIPSDADRRWLEPRLAALLGTGSIPEGDRGELFAGWRTFIESVASQVPVVLVFEDLHWADGGMLDFIESLMQWSRAFPILVITLARPELLERRPTWGAGLRSFTSLHLDPLPEDQMRLLLEGLVPGLAPLIVKQVVFRAEGVPLYAVETVRMLIDQGVLEATEAGFRVARTPERLALPETLHALIAARLDALPPAERRLLQDGSVLGQTFQREALLALTVNEHSAAVDQLVASLVAKELLRLENDPRSPELGQLGFIQSATREVAYAGLGRSERRARHVAAGDYFSELGEEDAVGIVASHYLAAYEAAPDHAQAPELRERARTFLLAAADRAHGLHSYDQTLAYLGEALDMTADSAERAGIHERAGNVARSAHDADAAQDHLSHAIDWYRSEGDSAAVARATTTLSTALIDEVRIEQAIELISRTIEEPGLVDSPAAVPLMANLARAYLNRGNPQEASSWADQAIAAGERIDDVASVIEALINRATAAAELGRPREGQALLTGALALAERQGASLSALRAANNLATLESEDSPRGALLAYGSALDLARAAGELGWVSNFQSSLLEMHFALGEWQAVHDQVASMDQEALLPHEWEHLYDMLAVIAAFQGDDARAAELLGRWQSDPQKTVTQHEAAHHAALGRVAFAQGLMAEAHTRAATAASSSRYHHDGHFLAGQAALWLRDAAKLSTALTHFEKEGAHTQLRKAQLSTLRAALAALAGDNAEVAYGEAIARWIPLENPLQTALAQLELATIAGSRAATEEAEAEARRLLASLRAEGLIDRLRNSVATKR
ncbi:MAG TPA: adenylate/guanylate cyclase domain-containing protein [Candidatus Limnocylindria bacterium]|nr:adenylate/guanylate cyclase domain-containing protein [Candidatus Limnocylindria bacterium]